jgi:hypothetical protein
MGGQSYIRRVVAGEYKPSKYSSPRAYYRNRSPNSPRYSPSPPRRVPTQAELNENKAKNEEALVRRKWNAMERDIAAEKARLAAEAKRIANAIKKQKQRNNRLTAAAAANVNNAKNLNKVFKNNKTILARLRRLASRVRK